VLVGQSAILHRLFPLLGPGVYLGKDLTPPFKPRPNPWYGFAKRRGWKVIHLDEEGAVHPGPENQWRTLFDLRLNPNHLALDDWICTWGRYQTQHYRAKWEGDPSRVVTTGHPRFDLARPAWHALHLTATQNIKARYGDFILVNTNFSIPNHELGPQRGFSESVGYNARDPEKRLTFVRQWGAHSRKLANLVELIHHIVDRFPQKRVVVRPHPSENMGLYQATLGRLENVHVVRQGPVLPWLIAAQVLIHDGCTTALEAEQAGKPVIAFEPEFDELSAKLLPNAMGAYCRSEEEVFAALRDPDRAKPQAHRLVAGHPPQDLLQNLESESWDALAQVIGHAASQVRSIPPNPVAEAARKRLCEAASLQRRVATRRPGALSYQRLKFAPLQKRTLEQTMKGLMAQLETKVSWQMWGKHVIRVGPQGAPAR
jgi:surface carbohydrate biosynthesis protein